jgi:hypothetical protein
LCREEPEFGAKYEALQAEAAARMAAGQPLATGSQRVNVVAAKAKEAGVSPATAKKVERAVKNNPEALDRIAKRQTTANEELGKTKGKARAAANPPGTSKSRTPDKGADKNVGRRTKEPEVRAGDLIYEVECDCDGVAGSPRIIEHEVRRVNKVTYTCADGTRLHKVVAFSLNRAKAQRIELIEAAKAYMEAVIKDLEEELEQEPTIVPAKKKQSARK